MAARIGYLFVDNSYGGGAAYDFRAKFSATSKFYATVGDFNNDGLDDLLIGISDYGPNRVGRVYLVPAPGFSYQPAFYQLDTAPYIWEGPGLGPVAAAPAGGGRRQRGRPGGP